MTIFYYDVYAGDGQIQVPSDAAAIVAKATEGTYYRDSEFTWFKQQAANRNLPFSGYHFLNGNGDPFQQAKYYFDFAGRVPCMVDVEPEDQANSKPTLDQTIAFIEALRGLGGHVWGVYFPRWYWGEVGGDLSRLTAAGAVVIASEYRSFDDHNWPAAYGGQTPPIWQYTSTPLDKNAFDGTPAQLAALINGDQMDPSTPLTFDPRIVGWYPDIAKDGGVWAGQQDAGDVWTWTAARVGHLVHVCEGLAAAVAGLTTQVKELQSTGAVAPTPAQNAAETLAELKARL